MEECGGKGNGAGGLRDEGGVGEEVTHGGEHLFFCDGEDSVYVEEDVLKVEAAEGLGTEAIGEGA